MGNSDFCSFLLKKETATKFSKRCFQARRNVSSGTQFLLCLLLEKSQLSFQECWKKKIALGCYVPKSLNFIASHIEAFKTRGSKYPVGYGQTGHRRKSSTSERSQPSPTRNLREQKCSSRQQLWMTTCPRTSWGLFRRLSGCLEKGQGLYFHTQLLLYDLVGKRLWGFL